MTTFPHNKGPILQSGVTLFEGDFLYFHGFSAILENGRFILYKPIPCGRVVLWEALPDDGGLNSHIHYITMESDGRLVFYSASGVAYLVQDTFTPGSYLELTATGDLAFKDQFGNLVDYLFLNNIPGLLGLGDGAAFGARFGHGLSRVGAFSTGFFGASHGLLSFGSFSGYGHGIV
jgi:hypothetical protein